MSTARRLTAEGLGTGMLVAAVVGSGIMAEGLTGDTALALLANTVATGAALVVLITLFGPVSGAHLNPAVTLVFAARREIGAGLALAYIAVQIAAGLGGSLAAHAMFDLPLMQVSAKARMAQGAWLAELAATFGLVLTILGGLRHRAEAVPILVGLYITGAYWFTASTSFANPAVTLARALSDSFAGIRPADVAPFIAAQLIGAAMAAGLAAWLFAPARPPTPPPPARRVQSPTPAESAVRRGA